MFYQLSIKFIAHILFRVTTSRLSPRAGWSWGRPPCRPRASTPASSPAETSPSLRTATPRLSWSPVSPHTNHAITTGRTTDGRHTHHQNIFLDLMFLSVLVPPSSRPTISGALTSYSPGEFVNLNCSTFNVSHYYILPLSGFKFNSLIILEVNLTPNVSI